MTIDDLIERRNVLQLRAEAVDDPTGAACWVRLGVANRHIVRIEDGALALTPAVEDEATRCFEAVERWLSGEQQS